MAKSIFEQLIDRSSISLTADDLKGLKKIGEYAFALSISATDGVSNIEIPNTVTSIEKYAFFYSKLTNITIPDSVTSIGNNAFYYSQDLTIAKLSNNVTIIEPQTFSQCRYLTDVTLPNKLITLGQSAFYYCDQLVSITIPDSVTSIEGGVFEKCTALTSITIPKNVNNIGPSVFTNSSGAMAITDAYFNQPSGMTVTLPTAGNTATDANGNKLYGMFYVKTARSMNVYTDNETIKNYNWSADNITPTFYHLDGTAWA